MTEVFDPQVIRPLFKQLVKDFGGHHAAGALLRVNPGNITKMINGDLPIHTHHWCMLEDAAGRHPITFMLRARVEATASDSNLQNLAEIALKELGDIPGAILQLIAKGDLSQIEKEGPELTSALTRLIDAAREVQGQ
jgi:hypothetical protein